MRAHEQYGVRRWGGAYCGTLKNCTLTGNTDGDNHAAWQEYLGGTVPTSGSSALMARVAVTGGVAVVTWEPDLRPDRVYTIEGRASLTHGEWGVTNPASRVFRVGAAMP